jgi:hypothetical protein
MRVLILTTLLLAAATPMVLADPPGGFSLPDQALFGMCTAWEHNVTGREHGNPENAPPFVWLQQQAEDNDQSVEEFCSGVSHPGA